MKLNVAVQMDPIERINIRGDSTFALLLEAQARGHALSYYTPDRLRLAGATPAAGAVRARHPFKARRAAARGAFVLRRGAAAPGPAVRPRLHHDHASSRAHPSGHAGRQRAQ